MQVLLRNLRVLPALVFVACLPILSYAQPLPCPPVTASLVQAGPDVTVCPGACATLQSFDTSSMKATTNYTVSPTPYLPYNFKGGTPIIVGMDDIWSAILPLTFDFCFYGQKYSSCIVGSNGQICFNTTLAGGANPWPISTGIPALNATASGPAVLNAILSPYHDTNPQVAGSGLIRYATYGVAPCRYFVVSWDSIPMFSCTTLFATQQIVLYETTHAIEVFIKDKPVCPNWNTGLAILGIQDATGANQVTAPGKNGTVWTSTNEGYRFTPSGAPTKAYTWTNLSTGIVMGTTPSYTACVNDTTKYELKVRWITSCDTLELRDTVQVNTEKAAVADFSYDIQYGCGEDTVYFTNLSTQNTFNNWDFADGNGDTATNPVHIYLNQNTYNVKLVVGNGTCKDSITKIVDTQHPLVASFTVDDDSVCQGTLVTFTSTSTFTTIEGPAHFFYDFGDGYTDTLINPTHIYQNTGTYNAMIVVTDFVPCSDTFYKEIIVDTIPSLVFTLSDSVLCEGSGVTFISDYSKLGNLSITWDFGDGTTYQNIDALLHAFDSAGNYVVTLTGDYRICPDTAYSRTVTVTPFPAIDLGPDTSLCPNGEALSLGDYKNAGNPAAQWLWNNGETTPSILVRHPGIYTARVEVDGCINSDSIEVFKDCYLDIPNSFTPNGDGVNDYFLPRQLLSKGVTAFKMSIYNRWGQLIFETNKIDGRGWDGKYNDKEQPMGVFVYLIDATLKSGNHERYQGNVTLIR